jgi:hypothetical protein
VVELDEDQDIAITLKVPRKLFVVVAPPPATVTQRTVTQHFGIPPRVYLDLVRDGRIAVTKLGQLRVAAYEDVRRVLTEGAEARARIQRAVRPAAEQPPDPDQVLEDATRYLDSAPTSREARQRKQEIQARAWELDRLYRGQLPDGSPNPQANHDLYELSDRLLLLAAGVRFKKQERGSGESRGTPSRRRSKR